MMEGNRYRRVPAMSTVSVEDLQQRIRVLESQMVQVLCRFKRPPAKDWRGTVGMFSSDPATLEVFDEAQRLREVDREAAKSDPRYFDTDDLSVSVIS
ncbi:MAG TPA: hypothetical protein VL096_10450 [Pirellulaceae bacterium]|nr:hypothetical protein [Pirellulaceae bacterium]